MSRARTRLAAVALVSAFAFAGCGGSGSGGVAGGGDSASPSGAAPDGSHVALIVLENHGFGQAIGNPQMPFFNRLAKREALATRYSAITHPSLPNYLALLGGATFGIDSDCSDCKAGSGPNLATQLSDAGLSWRAYMEDLPQACSTVDQAGGYVKRHDPFMYFSSVAGNPRLCANVVPGSRLPADIESGNLPAFSWITPNLCHDGHNCGLGAVDGYLARVVPALLDQLGPRGFLAVAFDENEDDEGEGGPGGGRIPVVIAGPTVKHGAEIATPYDHYSLLRTFEDTFGLQPLRNAAAATSMRGVFKRFPTLR